MQTYRTPGVYFEWFDEAPRVEALRTDIAGYVGIAQRGPLHHPVKVLNFEQFRTMFGDHIAEGYLAYAVEGFFANRGRECWIVRVDNPEFSTMASLHLFDRDNTPVLGEFLIPAPGALFRPA